MESMSSTPSMLPPSPPPLRPQLSHNAWENVNEKYNGVGYLLPTKNVPPQRKTSHLHFTNSTNTYKNNLHSSTKLSSMTPLVEEAGTLSKRVRNSEDSEKQQLKNTEYENGTENISNTYSQSTSEGYFEQSRSTVTQDAESDNDDSMIAFLNKRQESTDCDSINHSLRFEESPVTALLSPTASTTTLPYNSSIDTPRVNETYNVNESFDSWNNNIEKERKQRADYKNEEHPVENNENEANEEKYNRYENINSRDQCTEEVRSSNSTKHKLPLSTLPSSSSSSSLSEEPEEEQPKEEYEQEEYVEQSQSTLSTISVSSSESTQENKEHESVTHEEQNEMKGLAELGGDRIGNEEDERSSSSSSSSGSSSSLYYKNDDIFLVEEEEEEEEEEEQEQNIQELNVQMEEKTITRKLSSSDADTRNFILPPPMPLSPCEVDHLLLPNMFNEMKENNNSDDDSCLQTKEEHEEEFSAKNKEYEMSLLNCDKHEKSDRENYIINTIVDKFDSNSHDSNMHNVNSVNDKCEVNKSGNAVATTHTMRMNDNDNCGKIVEGATEGDMGVNNSNRKVVRIKKLVKRELELPFADEEHSDSGHTPTEKVMKWQENNNHNEPKTSNLQESTTIAHKSQPSTLTSELSSIILLSSSSTPPPLALLPRPEQKKTQTHLLLQETHNRGKQTTKQTQKYTIPNKDQPQMSEKQQEEEMKKLLHKAFVELGGRIVKANVNSRQKINLFTNNKHSNKNYRSKMESKINEGDGDNKDANRHIDQIAISRKQKNHGVQLGRLCRVMSEFRINFDVEKFYKENNLLSTSKQSKSNHHEKEQTEHSFHSLQLLPFRSQGNEFEEEENEAILTYSMFADIIKTALMQGKEEKDRDDSISKVQTHPLRQNKNKMEMSKHNDVTNKVTTNCQYMSLASERPSDLLMSSILSLHETMNNANCSTNNRNTPEKVVNINLEQSREKGNGALAEVLPQQDSSHSNASSLDVPMEHINAKRTKCNERYEIMCNTTLVERNEETSIVTATLQLSSIDHAEEGLGEVHAVQVTENSSTIESDLNSCHYTPHFSRFTSASSITSSARASSISSYYEDSAVNVEFPEVTPTSAIAELCRRIRHRLYQNKRMALQEREWERQSAKKSQHIKIDELSNHANITNAIETAQTSNKHTHRMKSTKDKNKVCRTELIKESTFSINVRESENDVTVATNGDKTDSTKAKKSTTAPTNTITSTNTNNTAATTITMSTIQKAHIVDRHNKPTKRKKNKILHSVSQSDTTSTSALPAGNANMPQSSTSHSAPEQRTSVGTSSSSSPSPVPKRPSLVATLHRPVILSSKVEEELVRRSPYYTKRFVQFRHASHLRSCNSNITTTNNKSNHSSSHQNKLSEFVVDSTPSTKTTPISLTTTAQSENTAVKENAKEPELFHRHSEPAQEWMTTPALFSASALSSAASLPLPRRCFTSPFRPQTPEWSSHFCKEPIRWSSNVSELFEQWKQERAFPSLSRPIRHTSATPFTNYSTTRHGRQNTHQPRRKVKNCNGTDDIKHESKNAQYSHHVQNEQRKPSQGTFRRHYEQNWMNNHKVSSLDNTKSNKEVSKCENNNVSNVDSMKWIRVCNSEQVNDPSYHNESNHHISPSPSPSLDLPCASASKGDTHNKSKNYVSGIHNTYNFSNENTTKGENVHLPSRQRTRTNLAIQWGRMKPCNHSSKVSTLLNSIYNSYRYNEANYEIDRRNARRAWVDGNSNSNDDDDVDVITSSTIDSSKTDGEEINRVHSALNALYTTKAELETLLHERIYSSSRTNNAVQITREQRVINQIKQKLNQVLDDISRYMQRVAPNTNIVCDNNYY